jgi:hypothetical protein
MKKMAAYKIRFHAPKLVGFSIVILAAIACLASKHFVMPTPNAARLYPAHDEHTADHVTVAVDPYDMADKAKIFSIHYGDAGFMPIFVIITNDSDQPLAIADAKAELVTVNHSRISPATEEDIARRMTNPSVSGMPSPVPWPKKVKGAFSKDQEDELESSRFAARAVEPHSTQAGFMFFDVSGITAPLAGANFVFTGVRDSKGNEMMYFEVPTEKYLSAPNK